MMKKLFSLLFVLFLVSCNVLSQPVDKKERNFKKLFPDVEMNTILKIEVAHTRVPLTTYSLLPCDITNLSKSDQIEYSSENLKAYHYQADTGQWSELPIRNLAENQRKVLNPESTNYSKLISLDLQDYQKEMDIRLVILDSPDDTEKNRVGAYTDIHLLPGPVLDLENLDINQIVAEAKTHFDSLKLDLYPTTISFYFPGLYWPTDPPLYTVYFGYFEGSQKYAYLEHYAYLPEDDPTGAEMLSSGILAGESETQLVPLNTDDIRFSPAQAMDKLKQHSLYEASQPDPTLRQQLIVFAADTQNGTKIYWGLVLIDLEGKTIEITMDDETGYLYP